MCFSRTAFWSAALLRRFRLVILLLVYRLVSQLGVVAGHAGQIVKRLHRYVGLLLPTSVGDSTV
jgi:hypothetical protein